MVADHQTISLLSTNKTPSTEHIQSNQQKRLSTPPLIPLREGEEVIHIGLSSLAHSGTGRGGDEGRGTGDDGRGTRDGGCDRSAGIGLRARSEPGSKREPGATCVRLYVSYG